MLVVTDLHNQSEPLVDYVKDSLSIKRKINVDYTLSFTVVPTEKNRVAYDMIQYEKDEYIELMSEQGITHNNYLLDLDFRLSLVEIGEGNINDI